MAVTLPLTGSGDVTAIAATDSTAAGEVQLIKLAIATAASSALVPSDATDGLLVNIGTNNDVTVTGSVTANAGTNLNTSLLALEAGGNLAGILADTTNIETAVQLIDDTVFTDDTSTHTTAVTKGLGVMAVANPTDAAVDANDIGMLGMTNNRELYVSIRDIVGAAAQSGSGTATGALRVEIANNGTGVLATVGTVSTVTAVTNITNAVTVAGGAANASPVSGNPVLVAGRASAAIPTDVGADGDAASMWTNRNGAQVVTTAPHIGLNGDPWSLVHEGVQYTTAQTSAVVVAGGASEKIVVTQVQIQAFSTTAGTAILYFGTGAFARGTNRAIFDGEFAPSATLKPGVILTGPFIAGTNGDDILFTSVGDVDVTISVWYYVVT